MNASFAKHPLAFSLFYQVVVVVLLMAILGVNDTDAARSFGLGSVIYILPNSYFIIYAFRYKGAHQSPWIIRSFNWGEWGKLALSMAGFALVFRFTESLSVIFVFAGYFTMILLQCWLAWHVAKALELPCDQD